MHPLYTVPVRGFFASSIQASTVLKAEVLLHLATDSITTDRMTSEQDQNANQIHTKLPTQSFTAQPRQPKAQSAVWNVHVD